MPTDLLGSFSNSTFFQLNSGLLLLFVLFFKTDYPSPASAFSVLGLQAWIITLSLLSNFVLTVELFQLNFFFMYFYYLKQLSNLNRF